MVDDTEKKNKTVDYENARFYADAYLECNETYVVETINCFTGEVVYYNSKG